MVFHGVATAGGTVSTVNPTYTAGEVRHQLQDSGATKLFTNQDALILVVALFLDLLFEVIAVQLTRIDAAPGVANQDVLFLLFQVNFS